MAFSVFALVSALGCINELAELFMVKAGLASIKLDDTNWDIFGEYIRRGNNLDWLDYCGFYDEKGKIVG